jgi:hypothetical protein
MHDPYAGALRAVCSAPSPSVVGGHRPLRPDNVSGGPMSQAFAEIFREIFFPYTAPPPEINANRKIAEEQSAPTWIWPESPWCEWTGDTNPVAVTAEVEVRLRNGQELSSHAGYFRWRHLGHEDDIVAYRVVLGEPDSDGWFAWPGGPCPIPPTPLPGWAGQWTLELRYREKSAASHFAVSPDALDWFHTDHPLDIVGFRLRPKVSMPKVGDPYKGGIFLGRTEDQHDLILHRVPV